MDQVGPGIRPVLIQATMFVAATLWTFVSSAASGGRPVPVAALISVAGVTYVIGRTVSARDLRLVPAAVVIVAAIVVVLQRGDAFTRAAAGGFLGYANARGAFFVQATIAATVLALRARSALGRTAALAAVGVFVAAAVASVSLAAAVLVLALPAAGLLPRSSRTRRLAVGALGGSVFLAVAVTSVIGASAGSGPQGAAGRVASEALTSRRLALWRSALEITADHPLTGVGPGRFRFESREAGRDRDAVWAHNGFLQQAAEAGIPGVLLLFAIFGWAFRHLVDLSATDQGVVLAAASLAGLGIHASIDYIFHFAAVPIAAAAVVSAVPLGTANGAGASRS